MDVALEFPTGLEGTSTTTTAGGNYTFDSIEEQSWTIEPELLGELGDSIDEMDAALVLSAATGETTLTPEQMLAADVTGNGSISGVDASLILQRVTGLIERFPVAYTCGSDWVFIPRPAGEPPVGDQTVTQPQISDGECVPGSITLEPLVGVIGGRDFLALAFGDVDGSWVSVTAGEGAGDEGVEDLPMELGHPRLRGASAQIPIEVIPQGPYRGLYLVIEYDPATVTIHGLRRVLEARDLLVVINDTEPGRLVVAAASAVDIETPAPFVLDVETSVRKGYPDVSITEADVGLR